MKILPFTIPVKKGESLVTNHEKITDYYPFYHRHKELQITYIINGQGSLLLNNNIFSFMPGNIYLIGANQAHLFKRTIPKNQSKSPKEVELMNIFIDLQGPLESIFKLPEWNITFSFLKSIGLARIQSPGLSPAINQLKTIVTTEGSQKIIKLLDFIEIILPYQEIMSSMETTNYSDSDGTRLNQVIQHLWSNYANQISLSASAQLVNMSPEAFSRYFKKRTNKTFISYLNELRIHQACKKIQQNNEISMGEIGFLCGFNNATHFNRIFKQVLRMSPSIYKKEIRHLDFIG